MADLTKTRSPLRQRPVFALVSAQVISSLGSQMTFLALPWFVLTTTGSPTKTGLIALFELTPMVLLKVLGGPLIDRLGARRVAITCDVGSLLVVGLIPLLHQAGLLTFPLFLLLCALAGALRGPGDAAKSALVPTIAAGAGVPLERVTGLGSTVERTSTMLGAIAAGALVASVGPAGEPCSTSLWPADRSPLRRPGEGWWRGKDSNLRSR